MGESVEVGLAFVACVLALVFLASLSCPPETTMSPKLKSRVDELKSLVRLDGYKQVDILGFDQRGGPEGGLKCCGANFLLRSAPEFATVAVIEKTHKAEVFYEYHCMSTDPKVWHIDQDIRSFVRYLKGKV